MIDITPIKQKIVISALVMAIAGVGLFTTAQAFAQETGTSTSSIVQKIADKFNLNKDEVQKVFDEEHAARHAEMEVKYTEYLSQAVTDGKITEAQKELILAKRKELMAEREAKMAAMKDKTEAERRAAMKSERAALQEWATQNNIDLQYLRGGMGKGGPGHMKMMKINS